MYLTDMEKKQLLMRFLKETEQEAAEDMSQEQTDAQAVRDQPDDRMCRQMIRSASLARKR
ncbi:MAG: hypothetical protein ACLRZ6_11825 [Lachnospiraceae bacterium]